jgi:hypothetical protein
MAVKAVIEAAGIRVDRKQKENIIRSRVRYTHKGDVPIELLPPSRPHIHFIISNKLPYYLTID